MDIGNFLDENNHGGIIEENDFFNHPEMDIEENMIEEKIPERKVWKWKETIARELMSGKHAQEIYQKYGKLITDSKFFDKIVKYIDKFDGLLGTIIIDASVFNDKFTYDDIPDKYSQFNLFAINSKNMKKVENTTYISDVDGTIDGFLGGDERKNIDTIFYDKDTGLEVIDDLSFLNDNTVLFTTAKKMLESGFMTQKQFEGFRKSNHKLNFIKKVFRGDFRKTLNAPIENVVSTFDLKQQELSEKPISEIKNINVSVAEPKLDSIKITQPEVVVVTVKKDKREDLPDFCVSSKKSSVKVEDLKEEKLDDIGPIKNEKIEVADDVKETRDGISELFDDINVSNANKQEIDEDEFFSQDNTDEEIEFDEKPRKQEVSNNYEFGW